MTANPVKPPNLGLGRGRGPLQHLPQCTSCGIYDARPLAEWRRVVAQMLVHPKDIPTTMAEWHITSDRLLIRPMQIAEATDWHRIRASAPYDPINRGVEESIALIAAMQRRAAADSDGWQQFAILAKDGTMVGDLGIRFSPPWNATAEIGFAVDPRVRGRGICSEAVEVMVKRLFHRERRRIVAVTDARNRPAQRVLERNWFRLEGRFVESWRDGEHWFDELSYARLASD